MNIFTLKSGHASTFRSAERNRWFAIASLHSLQRAAYHEKLTKKEDSLQLPKKKTTKSRNITRKCTSRHTESTNTCRGKNTHTNFTLTALQSTLRNWVCNGRIYVYVYSLNNRIQFQPGIFNIDRNLQNFQQRQKYTFRQH